MSSCLCYSVETQLEWDIILETVLFFVEELSAAGHEPWVGVEKKTPGYDIICFTHQALLQMGDFGL